MSHAVDVHVGKRLLILRKAAGLSQSNVAEQLGLTFQQVQKYEKGANRISASKLYQLALMMGVNVEAFFAGLELPDNESTDAAVIASVATDPQVAKLASLFIQTPAATRDKIIELVAVIAA